MHIVYPAVVSALLFSIGVYGVLARRNTILVLMSVELMLNAVNLNLVAFDVWLGDVLHSGQVLTLFVIVIAAAEVGVGLAIVLALFRNRQTVDIDHLRDLAEPEDDLSQMPAQAVAPVDANARGGDLEAVAAFRARGPADPGPPGAASATPAEPRPRSADNQPSPAPEDGPAVDGPAVDNPAERGDGRRVKRGGTS